MQGGDSVIALINALQSADDTVRNAAETSLNKGVKNNPWIVADSVLAVINENKVVDTNLQYAFIILKDIFSGIGDIMLSENKKKIAKVLSGADLPKYSQMMISYLVLISKNPDGPLRTNVIRCVSAFSEIVLSKTTWPGITQTIMGMVLSGDLEAQTVGALMAEELGSLNHKQLSNVSNDLLELIIAVSTKPIHTFKSTIVSIVSDIYSSLVISVLAKEPIYARLVSMINIFWSFLQAALEEGDSKSCGRIISSITMVMQCRTKLCTEDLLKGYQFMGNIILSGPQIPIELKKEAITLFVLYAKNFARQLFYPNLRQSPHSSPKKKHTGYIKTDVNANLAITEKIVEVLVAWCSDIPDSETWPSENAETSSHDEDDLKPDGSSYLFTVGQDMLDNICNLLGYRIMFGILKKLTPRLLISPEWTARSTACVMYCLCVEGLGLVPESLETVKEANVTLSNEDIGQICSWICSLANDPHPRVRWAVAQSLGQICVDLSPKVQQLCGKLVVETILRLMDDSPTQGMDMSLIASCRYSNPEAYFARPSLRVVAHSVGTLGNFYSDSKATESLGGKQNFVVASIEASLDKISRLMLTENLMIQKNCVSAIGSIANTSSTYFSTKYNLFIGPCLAQLKRYLAGEITEPPTKRPFAHLLIETISLMGHAVGPERFKNDGNEFLNMLVNYRIIGSGCLVTESSLRSVLFKAMTNVNNSMGKYLQQTHINAMMVTACETLKTNPSSMSIVDSDDPLDDESEGEIVNIGGTRVKYNTSVIEEVEDASLLLELLLGDHFIETSSFYTTILELSLGIIKENSQTTMEFALSNIVNIVKAIKKLIRCLQNPSKNESGLPITVTFDDIGVIQQNIFSHVLPEIVKLLPEIDSEINSSGICVDIIGNFIFYAPQFINGPNQATNMQNLEEFFIKPILESNRGTQLYFKDVVDNEEGEYDDAFILDEKDNYQFYTESVGLAISRGFWFMAKNPAFNFTTIYDHYFKEIVNYMLIGFSKEERDEYCDIRSAGCIVGQEISKLPQDVINGAPVLKQTLANVINVCLQIMRESLSIDGSAGEDILPAGEYPILQAGYYTMKCVLSKASNISLITEIFEYVAKLNGMSGAWDILDFTIDCCMKFTKLCLVDGVVDMKIQLPFDNASSCWFFCTLLSPQRYSKYFPDCLAAMSKICEDAIEIADIVKRIYSMFTGSNETEKQIVSVHAAQLISVLILLICNNVVRYALKPSVISLAKNILLQARSSDPTGFINIVKSLNSPIIEADIVEFLGK